MKKEYRDRNEYIDPEVRQEKTQLPFAIFLVVVFIVAYLVFQNLYFN
ncbi:MAG: hypothetical protein P1P88_24970 [Bacteroidales bacterium]|nr:hypothetical protein [Bacteroidales bacterium]